MNGHALGHVLRRALRSLRENLGLNTVAAGIIAVALTLVGFALTVQERLGAVVAAWGQDVQISAYLADGLAEDARAALLAEVQAWPEVQTATLVSEAEAATWLAEQVPDAADALDELGPDALPASLEIALQPDLVQDPEAIRGVAARLDRPEVAELDYGTAWVERFRAFLTLLTGLGAALGTLILVTAGFVVLNTVHLVVYSRRDEVEIQKLVGGTTAFIATPFILEGLAQGTAGALLALGGLAVTRALLAIRLQEALGLAQASLPPLPASTSLSIVLVGALLGAGAAAVAVLRFLRNAP